MCIILHHQCGLNNVAMTEKTKQLADGICQNRRALSRAITLVESRKPEHNKQAELLVDYVLEKREQQLLC